MSWNDTTEDDCLIELQRHSSNPWLHDATAGLRRFSSEEFAACSWSELLHSPHADEERAWQEGYASYASAEAATAIAASTSMSASMSQEAPMFKVR
jgi:hypothetical protein